MKDQKGAVSSFTRFLWWCAGVVPDTLRLYPIERAKYEGIGGAVFTTGVLAFFSGFYAIYSTLASGAYAIPASVAFGVIWALTIFNLDRYIVSSLRKPTDPSTPWRRRLRETLMPALPRLGLAILIGITISKPLELRLFQNAIAGQAAIDRDMEVTTKRASVIQSGPLGLLEAESKTLSEEIARAETRAQVLEDEFHHEADGTGGSHRYGYSDVAHLKESAAVQSRQQVSELQQRLRQVQTERDKVNAQIDRQVQDFRESQHDDFLTKMRALSELSANSTAVWWISSFIVLLLVGVEITPVLVKLLSPIGSYDVKLGAMFSVDTTEALLKRDTTNRVLAYQYGNVETAVREADGTDTALQQFISDVRTEILGRRTAG
jgi:hypothetical protein